MYDARMQKHADEEPKSLGDGLGTVLSDYVPFMPSGARRAGAARLMAARMGEDPSLLVTSPMLSQLAGLTAGSLLAGATKADTNTIPKALLAALGPLALVQYLKRREIKNIADKYDDVKKRKRLAEIEDEVFDGNWGGSSRLGTAQAFEQMRQRKKVDIGALSEAMDAAPIAMAPVFGLAAGLPMLPITDLVDRLEARKMRKDASFSAMVAERFMEKDANAWKRRLYSGKLGGYDLERIIRAASQSGSMAGVLSTPFRVGVDGSKYQNGHGAANKFFREATKGKQKGLFDAIPHPSGAIDPDTGRVAVNLNPKYKMSGSSGSYPTLPSGFVQPNSHHLAFPLREISERLRTTRDVTPPAELISRLKDAYKIKKIPLSLSRDFLKHLTENMEDSPNLKKVFENLEKRKTHKIWGFKTGDKNSQRFEIPGDYFETALNDPARSSLGSFNGFTRNVETPFDAPRLVMRHEIAHGKHATNPSAYERQVIGTSARMARRYPHLESSLFDPKLQAESTAQIIAGSGGSRSAARYNRDALDWGRDNRWFEKKLGVGPDLLKTERLRPLLDRSLRLDPSGVEASVLTQLHKNYAVSLPPRVKPQLPLRAAGTVKQASFSAMVAERFMEKDASKWGRRIIEMLESGKVSGREMHKYLRRGTELAERSRDSIDDLSHNSAARIYGRAAAAKDEWGGHFMKNRFGRAHRFNARPTNFKSRFNIGGFKDKLDAETVNIVTNPRLSTMREGVAEHAPIIKRIRSVDRLLDNLNSAAARIAPPAPAEFSLDKFLPKTTTEAMTRRGLTSIQGTLAELPVDAADRFSPHWADAAQTLREGKTVSELQAAGKLPSSVKNVAERIRSNGDEYYETILPKQTLRQRLANAKLYGLVDNNELTRDLPTVDSLKGADQGSIFKGVPNESLPRLSAELLHGGNQETPYWLSGIPGISAGYAARADRGQIGGVKLLPLGNPREIIKNHIKAYNAVRPKPGPARDAYNHNLKQYDRINNLSNRVMSRRVELGDMGLDTLKDREALKMLRNPDAIPSNLRQDLARASLERYIARHSDGASATQYTPNILSRAKKIQERLKLDKPVFPGDAVGRDELFGGFGFGDRRLVKPKFETEADRRSGLLTEKSASAFDQNNAPVIGATLLAGMLGSVGQGISHDLLTKGLENDTALSRDKWRDLAMHTSGKDVMLMQARMNNAGFGRVPESADVSDAALQMSFSDPAVYADGRRAAKDKGDWFTTPSDVVDANTERLRNGVIIGGTGAYSSPHIIAHEAGHAKIEHTPGMLRFAQRNLYPLAPVIAPLTSIAAMAAGLKSKSAIKGGLLGALIGTVGNAGIMAPEFMASYKGMQGLNSFQGGALRREGAEADLVKALGTYAAANVLPSVLTGALGGYIGQRRAGQS